MLLIELKKKEVTFVGNKYILKNGAFVTDSFFNVILGDLQDTVERMIRWVFHVVRPMCEGVCERLL